MNTMKDYDDLYLKVDVSFSTCVFETFWKESINYFELCPAHYLSTHGYSWDAILKFTDVNSKLIPGIENYKFIESTIRGVVSMICMGYAEVNHTFLKPSDSNKPTSYVTYVTYLDTNNLYGHSMMKFLPTEILEWSNPKDFNLDNYSNNS